MFVDGADACGVLSSVLDELEEFCDALACLSLFYDDPRDAAHGIVAFLQVYMVLFLENYLFLTPSVLSSFFQSSPTRSTS